MASLHTCCLHLGADPPGEPNKVPYPGVTEAAGQAVPFHHPRNQNAHTCICSKHHHLSPPCDRGLSSDRTGASSIGQQRSQQPPGPAENWIQLREGGMRQKQCRGCDFSHFSLHFLLIAFCMYNVYFCCCGVPLKRYSTTTC